MWCSSSPRVWHFTLSEGFIWNKWMCGYTEVFIGRTERTPEMPVWKFVFKWRQDCRVQCRLDKYSAFSEADHCRAAVSSGMINLLSVPLAPMASLSKWHALSSPAWLLAVMVPVSKSPCVWWQCGSEEIRTAWFHREARRRLFHVCRREHWPLLRLHHCEKSSLRLPAPTIHHTHTHNQFP